jgi:membrane-associated protein
VFSTSQLLLSLSYLGVFLIVFAETGLLVGFFLPADSLLITAGVLAAAGKISLPAVMVASLIGGTLGNALGYLIGRQLGPAVFSRPRSRWFKPEYVERAHAYFERFGSYTLLIARFVPVVRTFAPTMAGVGKMRWSTFTQVNVIGSVLWSVLVSLVGFFLGRVVPHVDHYILLVIGAVIVLSLIPVALELRHARLRSRAP